MKRSIISQVIAILFLILSITGVMMYVLPFQKSTAILHITIGLIFILIIPLHIINNYKPLLQYLKGKKKRKVRINPTFIIISFVVLLLLPISKFDLPPLNWIYSFGEDLKGDTDVYYKHFTTNDEINGESISVEVRMNKPTQTPTVAIWLEDAKGNYLEELYVSQKLARQSFINFNHKRRPEALPVWTHRRGIKAKDGLYVPDEESAIVDGISGATPKTNWILNSKLHKAFDSIRVFLEINQSFDWNEYYNENAFPDDMVYSGPGKVGQPALIYATKLMPFKKGEIEKMRLIGRGHHSGKNGKIYGDLDKLTSALEIVDRILVEF